MRKISTIIIFFLISHFSNSQNSITGSFTGLANQTVKLGGFNGFDSYTIATTTADAKGLFSLAYTKQDYGMGYLMSGDGKPFFVVLSGEDIVLEGEVFAFVESINIVKGSENQLFGQYASEHPRREQALSAWGYLEKIYSLDSLFTVENKPRQAIADEMHRIKTQDSLFLAGLDKNSFISWFLPVRKLVSSVSTIAQYRTEEIPAAMRAFRSLDLTDTKLYKSGLFKDAIESHFWLLENCGKPLDSVFVEMKISIDSLLLNIETDKEKFNSITNYLFDLLERHSLFDASEYLAIKVLTQNACTLDENLAKQLETYRLMKKGNTAPDFDFAGDMIAPLLSGSSKPMKLSALKSKYTLVVFGASWCPKCAEELPQIARLYPNWKNKGLEVVFVSLDTEKQTFGDFAAKLPFISLCDYKKWESPAVESYHVFATPSMFLLDSERKILLRPNSVSQMDSWVDWYLVQGNKL